ncbi:hypothetical protein BDZ90DRAFT_77159 [Jaminaea rosea]|uniref:Uncharacterized protein n=1 Tax=Jaminaea rosea TaxID=1569628 RepID=A0A316UJW1_9BASI|nr:hypothetical protein BDZ90DRAFT_77159 [Jaminaea rosea]PWN25088.1 hypothetical protein BDZ90DRAFT_77159 [Jaminaea rosea]
MTDPIEISSSDEARPPRDTRKTLGKGHPSSASLRAAMSSSSEPRIRGKRAAPKNPRSASSSTSSSSSAAPPAVKKRKRDPSYDSDVDEKKPKPKGASRRKLTLFEPWEDAVFIDSVLTQYSTEHLVSMNNIVQATLSELTVRERALPLPRQAIFNEINKQRLERGLPLRDEVKQVGTQVPQQAQSGASS